MSVMCLFVVAQSEGKGSSSQRLVSSLSTLYLISKIKPQLLVKHAMTLQPYLSTKCSVSMKNKMLTIENKASRYKRVPFSSKYEPFEHSCKSAYVQMQIVKKTKIIIASHVRDCNTQTAACFALYCESSIFRHFWKVSFWCQKSLLCVALYCSVSLLNYTIGRPYR